MWAERVKEWEEEQEWRATQSLWEEDDGETGLSV